VPGRAAERRPPGSGDGGSGRAATGAGPRIGHGIGPEIGTGIGTRRAVRRRGPVR